MLTILIALRNHKKPGSTVQERNFSCALDFSEEPQVAKKVSLDPTALSGLPAAPPKSEVHTKEKKTRSMIKIQISGFRGADL